MIFKNYIFDLDGTLVNSSAEVLKCFEKAFEKANFKIDKTRLIPDIIGPPLPEIIKTIVPNIEDENKISEIIQYFRGFYDYSENDISIMYDGIYDLLRDLKNSDCRLFIATFKPQVPTLRLIKKFQLEAFFDDIYAIDKFGEKITKEEMIKDIISTYNLKKEETVMIGDAASDMIAAKQVNIKGIGVLWGYGSDKEPLKQNADYVLCNVGEALCKI